MNIYMTTNHVMFMCMCMGMCMGMGMGMGMLLCSYAFIHIVLSSPQAHRRCDEWRD